MTSSSKIRRRLMLAALALLSFSFASFAPLALGANYPNFEPAQPIGANPPTGAFWDLRIRPRNVDNEANIAASSESGGAYSAGRVILVSTANLGDINDVTGSAVNPDLNSNNKRSPRLNTDNQGNSYLGFQWIPPGSGARGYITLANPSRQVFKQVEIGDPSYWGGGAELRFPDVVKSNTTGKMYITGELYSFTGAYYWYFAESNDNGTTVTGVRDLLGVARDANNTTSILSRACVGPNDNLFMAARFGTGVALATRINGVWSKDQSTMSAGNNGGVNYRYDLDIACAPDGNAYVVAHDGAQRIGLARYTPGVGWQKLSSDLFSGIQSSGPDVTVSPDGRVWIATGAKIAATTTQTQVLVGAPQGNGSIVFDAKRVAMTLGVSEIGFMPGVGIRSGPSGRVHIGATINNPRASYYSSTEAGGGGTVAPAITGLSFNDEASQLSVNWQDRSGDETGFTIQRRPKGTTAWTTAGTVGANVTGFVDGAAFSQNTIYEYQVIANSGQPGTSAVAELLVQYIPENPPPTPALTALSSSSIRINWQDPSNIESGFVIERAVFGGSWAPIAEVGPNVTSYTDTNLQYGVLYTYRISNKRADLSYTSPPGGPAVPIATLPIRRLDITFPNQNNLKPGTAFPIQPIIILRDINGQAVSNYTGPVVISIATGPAGATLGGTATKNASDGSSLVDFAGNNLNVNKVGRYTLRATVGDYSQVFGSLVVGARLEYNNPASGATVNYQVNEQFAITAKVTDVDGGALTNATFGDTLELLLDSTTVQNSVQLVKTGASSITGTVGAGGLVTFSNLRLTNLVQGLKFVLRPLNGNTPILSIQPSPLVNATGVLEVSNPTPGTPKVNTYFKLSVTVKDFANSNVPYSGPVVLTNVGGDTLSGVTMVNASNGVATFNSLIVLNGGGAISNYTVQASIPGIATTGGSVTFNLDARDGSCDGLLVNANSGTDNWTPTNCGGTVTLEGALGRAQNGDTVLISQSLGGTVAISAGSDINVPAGVSIEAGCTGSGSRLTLTGTGNLTLNGNQTLRGIFLNGIKPVQAAGVTQVRYSCSKVSR